MTNSLPKPSRLSSYQALASARSISALCVMISGTLTDSPATEPSPLPKCCRISGWLHRRRRDFANLLVARASAEPLPARRQCCPKFLQQEECVEPHLAGRYPAILMSATTFMLRKNECASLTLPPSPASLSSSRACAHFRSAIPCAAGCSSASLRPTRLPQCTPAPARASFYAAA